MGMLYADYQEKAARYLVKVLQEKGGRVHYNHFYGTTEASDALLAGMELEEGECDSPELAMDIAANEMQTQGFVKLHWLEGETLADGEPAYVIELTAEGREKLQRGQWPKFRHLDM